MLKKLLIANRGEIVLRVARSCRELGIATVGVYSEADANAAHVREVDEAYLLGAAAPSESYLNQDKILEVAKKSGADAIHPGYGFLSENSGFARRVQEAGLIWVGPPADAIDLMGDKILSRKTAKKLGVPMIPGTEDALDDPDELAAIAEKLGYPVLLKASGGGGGKGIRLVHSADRLIPELNLARSEATKAFGNPAVFMEKAIINGRHIELQIMATPSGRVLHFGERECSLQRRHQKLLEEAPSSISNPGLRERLVKAGLALSSGIGYRNAGTIEFLVDSDENVYFLEMNTRLQVEHAVSEMISGVDLVRMQLQVASGIEPEITQDDIQFRGHALEYRVYAEDPFAGFTPSTGTIEHLSLPSGPFVRLDSALFEGDSVSLHYDPMLAKLVVWGADRQEAIQRLKRAAEDFLVLGPKTSLPLVPFLAESEDFKTGRFHTKWLVPFVDSLENPGLDKRENAAIAAALTAHQSSRKSQSPSPASSGTRPWTLSGRPGFPSRI
ncbi:MAG: biotin carboxylase N-terminal domain-containing protein [Planctomycetota bacterium]|nr:biotin carboxylase N-terminal domain-containing protein [Planctomycetota bacterium]